MRASASSGNKGAGERLWALEPPLETRLEIPPVCSARAAEEFKLRRVSQRGEPKTLPFRPDDKKFYAQHNKGSKGERNSLGKKEKILQD